MIDAHDIATLRERKVEDGPGRPVQLWSTVQTKDLHHLPHERSSISESVLDGLRGRAARDVISIPALAGAPAAARHDTNARWTLRAHPPHTLHVPHLHWPQWRWLQSQSQRSTSPAQGISGPIGGGGHGREGGDGGGDGGGGGLGAGEGKGGGGCFLACAPSRHARSARWTSTTRGCLAMCGVTRGRQERACTPKLRRRPPSVEGRRRRRPASFPQTDNKILDLQRSRPTQTGRHANRRPSLLVAMLGEAGGERTCRRYTGSPCCHSRMTTRSVGL